MPLDHTSPSETVFLFERDTLVDASEGGEMLLGMRLAEGSDWARLAAQLLPRFPDMPETPPELIGGGRLILNSMDHGRASRVIIEPVRRSLRVRLIEAPEGGESTAELHNRRIWEAQLDTLRAAVQGAPYPIWRSDEQGRVLWSNAAYEELASAVGQGDSEQVFPGFAERSTQPSRCRLAVTLAQSDQTLWYDVTTVQRGRFTMHYAIDINAVVQAEVAQRNFVQTLTKTFAQLSIGLAIFDRKRELTLFNPALADLTELPASFLSNRPSLNGFFDRLRDGQMMPEPRNYQDWRDQISTLADAAADGRFLETWNLPSGLTYRVSGRPHPDGAIAFLFEDISAEVSLTRRFRADLELNQAVLNHLEQPVAVFSSSGMLNFCNSAYGQFWGIDPDRSFVEVTIMDSLRLWQSKSKPDSSWDELTLRVASRGALALSGSPFTLSDGRRVIAWARNIAGGATMIHFEPPGQGAKPLRFAETA